MSTLANLLSYGVALATLIVTVCGEVVRQPRAVSFGNSSITTSSSQHRTITRTLTRTRFTSTRTMNTSLTMTTSDKTSKVTAPKPDIPPCCWVYGGSFAININSWWTSTWSIPVATEVQTLLSYPDSIVTANSTTITAQGLEASIQAMDDSVFEGPLTTDVVPSDLVNSIFLSDAASYGRSRLHLGTTAASILSDHQMYSPATVFLLKTPHANFLQRHRDRFSRLARGH